jgi:hypothetical protein
MRSHRSFAMIVGALFALLLMGCAAPSSEGDSAGAEPLDSAASALAPVGVSKTFGKKIYVHIMPWFESNATSGNGAWGLHWTMANQNPNATDASGRRQIASYYYPLIGPYGSGDKDVIEYQLLLMKYAGVDGVLIDWPGTINAWDYPKNRQNSEAIIALTAAVGLDFAVVYEDHNVGMAFDAGLIQNKIAAAQADVTYLKNNYFTRSNYIKVNSAPLLLDFGPQTFLSPSDWTSIFAPLPTKPTFLSLWYQSNQPGANASGEYPWIYSDFTTGLTNFYNNRPLNVKFGVAYPGFNTFYTAGGWGGPGWSLPYNGTGTFGQTLDLAKNSGVNYIQLATWNDYGEGTMIEPTREFGYGFLTTLQQKLGVSYSQTELELINTLYQQRKQYAGNGAKQADLDQAFNYLVALQVASATSILNGVAPPPPPPPPAGTSYYIKSAWKGTYLYDANQKVAYGASINGSTYEWALEDKNGFKRIKNVGTGRYLNIENLLSYVESTTLPDTFYSGYWTLESVSGNTRLKNAWQSTYLNVEGQTGYAQCSNLPSNYTSSQWTLVAK